MTWKFGEIKIGVIYETIEWKNKVIGAIEDAVRWTHIRYEDDDIVLQFGDVDVRIVFINSKECKRSIYVAGYMMIIAEAPVNGELGAITM